VIVTEGISKLRVAVVADGQVNLHGLDEAAAAEGCLLTWTDSVAQLAALAEAGQCDVAIVASEKPSQLSREAVQNLLGLIRDVVVVLMMPTDFNAANCPAILGATSDQIWDLHAPPRELLAAVRREVERTADHRPEYEVLCVDDDLEFLASLRRLLVPAAERPFSQFTLDFNFASNPSEAMTIVQTLDRPLAVVVCDQVMPQMQGMDLLRRLKDIHPTTRRVLLTGYAGLESAVRAVNEQLLDKYLTKPVEDPSEFVGVITGQAREYHLRSQATRHRRQVMAQFEFIQAMTGTTELDAALDTTTGFLVRQLGAPWAALFLREDGQFVLRSTAGQSLPSPTAIGKAWQDYIRHCGLCNQLSEIVRNGCADTPKEEDGQPPAYAVAVAPLTVRQELLGVVVVGAEEAGRSLARDDRLLTTFVADIAAATIIQIRDHEALESTYVGAMASLMDVVEAKDSYTRGHTDRVLNLAVALAEATGLSEEAMKNIRYGAALHDLGKLAVPESILRKPGNLNPKEQAVVMEHPARADAILKHLRFLDAARLIIRSHHERFDGKGYPDRLAGEEIPMGARILAVVDSYDAMTSSRPYRRAMTHEQALAQIRAGAGTQFDPALAALFVEMMQTGDKIRQIGSQSGPIEMVEVQQP
jgi:response regulator RpfG family c-di-GMP phosphodiesterase